MLKPEPATQTPFLILDEPDSTPALMSAASKTNTNAVEMGFIASKTGELLHGCEAKSFELTLSENGRPTADLPLNEENAPAFDCVLAKATARNYRMDIELRPD